MAFGFLAAFLWSFTSPLIGLLAGPYGVPSLTLALWRDVFASVALVLLVFLPRRNWFQMPRATWLALGIIGAIGIGVYHAIWTVSVKLNGAALAVVMVYLYATLTAVAQWLLFREPVSRWQVIGLVVSLVGCALAVRVWDAGASGLTGLGLAAGLGTAVVQTFYVIGTQRIAARPSTPRPWAMLSVLFWAGSATLFALNLIFNTGQMFAVPSGEAWFLLVMLALAPTIGAYACYNVALRHIAGSVAGIISSSELIWAGLLAFLLLGERLGLDQLAGCALVLASTLIANVKSK